MHCKYCIKQKVRCRINKTDYGTGTIVGISKTPSTLEDSEFIEESKPLYMVLLDRHGIKWPFYEEELSKPTNFRP